MAGRVLDYASYYVSAFVVLLRLTRRGDVIVAKTDPPLISVVAWWVARLRGARLVNWLQDVFPEVAIALGVVRRRALVRPLVALRNGSLRGADMNVVLGERMRQTIVSLGAMPQRIAVIHNWADGALIRPVPQEENPLRRAWGLDGKFVVGYSGNLGRVHEFGTIVGAMERLRSDDGIVFVFIGGGSGRPGLERAASAAGLRNVAFFPYQERARLSESLSVPDLHVVSLLPQVEGLVVPSKVYGIVAAGRPFAFIGDPDGEVGRLVSRCRCGFTVVVGDADELVRRLLELKADPRLGTEMGANGRRCLDSELDRVYGVGRWGVVLERLCDTRPAAIDKVDKADV